MTPDDLAQVISLGHETPGVEFKGPFARTDMPAFAKVVRAVLAMANRRDGGKVVIGIEEQNVGGGKGLVATGLSTEQIAAWDHDGVVGVISGYADPFVTLTTHRVELEERQFVALVVDEFELVPVLCKKDYLNVLRQGACYVRRRGPIESSEIPTHVEMRDLIELATEKGLRKFLLQAHQVGIDLSTIRSLPTDAERFEQQRGYFR